MNYILEYLLPSSEVNLTMYGHDIMNAVDNLPFTLIDKRCYMPVFVNDSWHLFYLNAKKRTYICYNPSETQDINFDFFLDFIKSYNSSSRHKTKLRSDSWTQIPFDYVTKATSTTDSGIYVIKMVYQFVTQKTVNDSTFDCNEYRQLVINEISQFSDDMKDLCPICGEENDASQTEKVTWTLCDRCNRWFHDACCSFVNGLCPICSAFQPDQR